MVRLLGLLSFLSLFAIPALGEDLSYETVLPENVRSEALAALRKIPFDEKRLASKPSLLFMSGEVRNLVKKERMLLRAHFFPGPRFDTWLLRHSGEGKGFDFSRWNLFAILVDKKSSPKKSYFLEFRSEPIAVGALPQPKMFTAACFSCHASGPRVMRPEVSSLVPALGKPELDRLRKWNEVISSYRAVETYFLPHEPLTAPERLFAFEQLRHRACVACHDGASGVRAPLLRLHGKLIDALIRSSQTIEGFYVKADPHLGAIMPMGDSLTPEEIVCLSDWTKRKFGQKPQPGCNEKGEITASKGVAFAVNSARSWVRANSRTPVSEISIKGMHLSGEVECANGDCRGEIRADLRKLSSGIRLRDSHIRDLLKVTEGPFLIGNLSGARLLERETPARLALTLAGGEAQYSVMLQCEDQGPWRRCEIKPFKIQLDRHEVRAPSFLSIKVENEVVVRGEVFFEERR